jgi:hypothetical protein
MVLHKKVQKSAKNQWSFGLKASRILRFLNRLGVVNLSLCSVTYKEELISRSVKWEEEEEGEEEIRKRK